jgi:hypothetical protein
MIVKPTAKDSFYMKSPPILQVIPLLRVVGFPLLARVRLLELTLVVEVPAELLLAEQLQVKLFLVKILLIVALSAILSRLFLAGVLLSAVLSSHQQVVNRL